MGSSATFIVSLLLMFGGTFVALSVLKGGSERERASHIVPLPRIGGGSLQQGPWPDCVGLVSTQCVSLIESHCGTSKCQVVVVVADEEEDHAVKGDFDPNRVRVYVDEDGVVQAIPRRGN